MTRERAEEILSKLSMGEHEPKIHFKHDYDYSCDALRVVVYMRVLDVKTGFPTKAIYNVRWDNEALKDLTEVDMIGDIGEAIKQLVIHEVEEFFTFDGKQVFDPHPEDKVRNAKR